MQIKSEVCNSFNQHLVTLSTNNSTQSIVIPSKPAGFGSGVNGGELLFLSLATCYCNDVYREAAQRNISVSFVEVTVEGEFGSAGEPARYIRYRAKVGADATVEEIKSLMLHTDAVSEIQNTLRKGMEVKLVETVAVHTGAQ